MSLLKNCPMKRRGIDFPQMFLVSQRIHGWYYSGIRYPKTRQNRVLGYLIPQQSYKWTLWGFNLRREMHGLGPENRM